MNVGLKLYLLRLIFYEGLWHHTRGFWFISQCHPRTRSLHSRGSPEDPKFFKPQKSCHQESQHTTGEIHLMEKEKGTIY